MANYKVFNKVPAHPNLMAKLRRTKRLVRSGAELSRFEGPDVLDIRTYSRIISRPASSRAHTLVSPTREFAPAIGTQRALVLLVDFSDNTSDEQLAHFEDLLFSQGSYATGSMRDYYQDISYNQLNVIGEVFGWYRAPEPYSYYTNNEHGFGGYPQNVHKLVEDVVYMAQADVDFADYDLNNDGYVDALFIVHAGTGAESTLNPDHIWSHRSSVFPPISVSGVNVSGYTMEPEDGRVGVFSHEFGHNLGLPDLYDTGYDSSGIGDWCLMAGGSWNNNGLTPAHMSAWCKLKLGWVTPRVIFDAQRAVSLASSTTTTDILKVPIGNQSSKEFFLIENRQKEQFDQHLPGEGLLIWHIDDNQVNNNDQTHFLVALEQADGLAELEKGIDEGDTGDPFPGNTGNNLFDGNTNPSSMSYDGTESKIEVSNISEAGATITFTVREGDEPTQRTLGDRPPEDLFGVSRGFGIKFNNNGITTISQVAEMNVLSLVQTLGQDAIKMFSFKARAQSVANFDLVLTPFQSIREIKVNEILERSMTDLIDTTGQPEVAISGLKDQLAKLAAALDKKVLKQLKLEDVS